MKYVTAVVAIIFILVIVSGLPVMIWHTLANTSCCPVNYTVTSWLLVGFLNYIFLTLFYKVLAIYLKARKNKNKADKMRKGIDKIYNQAMRNDFDVEAFIKEHGELVINLFKLTDREIEILNEKFVVESKVDQSTLPENERKSCIICLGDFEKGEKIVLHPGCKHTFHDECVLEWFKTKLKCPVCKKPTRSNMLRNLCNGDT
jgi:hypothetical protein